MGCRGDIVLGKAPQGCEKAKARAIRDVVEMFLI
jgi:hypothetical protein